MNKEMFDLLLKFYDTWGRSLENRGCYSCVPDHDCRCDKERGLDEEIAKKQGPPKRPRSPGELFSETLKNTYRLNQSGKLDNR
jgi:hypothetical protein